MAQDNVDVVQGAWDAFGRGDIDAVLEAISPSAETQGARVASLGWNLRGAGRVPGLPGQAARRASRCSAPLPRRFSAPTTTTSSFVAKTKGRTKGGATIEGTAIWIYQLRDGKIADAESFGDTAQVLEALG